ncbi:putative toxin-antitoxin system toxin component, PIN family [Leptolyngbya sp. 'hensonii']|uniref:putative toxin-antitoxin system toxin component, PIN family n=1 Tax=Leptolyngbya sp. 'hensonii' TaxID=1922337 RepID=UPI00094F847C|nr:putative toxin-antitoxin system toxin component, PIN family [Leptolyngbya sp. 'hensonii']OLP20053.1 putative toxin-antitoxin system toxin component, PIN family [Leptolyngbya sp. 'hensonii']
MKYTAVFDTNILLSALLSQNGNPFRCLALAKIGQVESITCEEILNEFTEKLLIKFKFSEEATQSVVEEVRRLSCLVSISKTLKVVPDDADDDMVIECAVNDNATHIVTGDKHLLSLTNYQNIAIVKASEFIALHREPSS